MEKYESTNKDMASLDTKLTIKDLSIEKYTFNYRVLKTVILIMAWISFGLNFEIIGSTLEDLKIYLDVDYKSVSFSLVNRSIGYLLVISFCGIIFDRYSNYSDLIMAICCLFIAIRKLF